MKKGGIGVFSDIHGNRQAFAAIIGVVRARQDLQWLCLGDVVGWFFRPVECVIALKQLVDEGLVAAVVPGNHDVMALDGFTDDPAMPDRMLATAFSAGALSQCREAIDFLRSLKRHTIEGDTWIAGHHSPFGLPEQGETLDASNYGAIEKDLPEQLGAWSKCPKSVLLTGHGHVATVYGMPEKAVPALSDVTTWHGRNDAVETAVPIRPGWRYWVRNGTVGGPYRAGPVAAHWTEYRPGERFVMHRVMYDTREIQSDIAEHHHLMTHRDAWQKRMLAFLQGS